MGLRFKNMFLDQGVRMTINEMSNNRYIKNIALSSLKKKYEYTLRMFCDVAY